MSFQKQTESPENSTKVAVLFADLVNSTGLYESKGNVKARQLVSQYLNNLIHLIKQNSGTIVKTLGDGVLAYYADIDNAIQSAIEIHQLNMVFDDQAMLSHIGVHYGDVIIGKNDIFGDAVNLASRLADIAKSEQTILSEQAVALSSEIYKSQLRNIDMTLVKGKKQAIKIYELVNQNDDQTIMCSVDIRNKTATNSILSLSCKDYALRLNEQQGTLRIGRDNDCELVIESPLISRHHAKINYHKGKFIFADQSTNGSYILSNNNREVFLLREQTVLPDKGIISVGVQVEKNTDGSLIYFSIR